MTEATVGQNQDQAQVQIETHASFIVFSLRCNNTNVVEYDHLLSAYIQVSI